MFTETIVVADERQLDLASREDAPALPACRIVACERGDANRAEAEAFVRRRFLRSHGAHIATFMPTLMLLTGADGELAAVAGFRNAAS